MSNEPVRNPEDCSGGDSNIQQVTILNSQINTRYYMYVQKDRILEFYTLIKTERCPSPQGNECPMPGLSWNAILGLDKIFARRPQKFPVNDLVLWLRDQYQKYMNEPPDPALTKEEVEHALERFAMIHPPSQAIEIEDA